MTLDDATKMADTIIAYRSHNRWFLPGTREKLIEAAWNSKGKQEVLHEFTQILEYGEIDDPGSDPCDEVRHDRWFYYHPALVL